MSPDRIDPSPQPPASPLLPSPLPTSVRLAQLLDRVQGARAPIGWLIRQLGERSFGLILFAMALLALLPGASTLMGMLIAWPAVQMLLGHDVASLPRAIERRQVRVERLSRAVRVVTPYLQRVEHLVRPRWPTPFHIAKRLTGLVMLLLGLSLVSPVPFGHVLPALVIMLLALAYLEEDGVALLVALLAAALSLAVTGATVWGVVEAIDWIDPKAPACRESPEVL